MANPYQLACIAQTRSSFICRSQNKARGTDLKKEEWDVEGQSVQLAGEAGGRGERARCKHITSCRPLTTWGSGKTFLAFFPPSPHFPTNFAKFGLAHARGFLGAGRGFDGIGRRKDGWIGGWTSCHDDRVALSVCWLMKSLFDCLSNQMAEQRMQHEQERTRLQQQHSAEKDSLVQEHQREVSSLERQARAALQQHQQHTQEWRKRDAQVGGLHWSTHSHAHTHALTRRSPVDNHFVFCSLTFSWGFKSTAGWDTFLFEARHILTCGANNFRNRMFSARTQKIVHAAVWIRKSVLKQCCAQQKSFLEMEWTKRRMAPSQLQTISPLYFNSLFIAAGFV